MTTGWDISRVLASEVQVGDHVVEITEGMEPTIDLMEQGGLEVLDVATTALGLLTFQHNGGWTEGDDPGRTVIRWRPMAGPVPTD